ncbi:MAG TPA: ATP-dependent sacrificial sulfur transferase LarE [Methanoregulaceae archaeon]|nr:ATP-dependent sacrificial sulfur transferase LarE [Methanoregulaceae archaeon]
MIAAATGTIPLQRQVRRMTGTTIEERMEQLRRRISGCDQLVVSFSGGVDSGLLAALGKEILGDNVQAVFIDSPLVPRSAVSEAREMAGLLGIPLEIISVPFPGERVSRNLFDRCYHCKRSWSALLRAWADKRGISCIADGVTESDRSEHRPGIRAATEAGIIHPFLEAGITKAEIRQLARERGLSFWDKPSSACLASRIPYGEALTCENLRMVEEAEAGLAGAGFAGSRVRNHGGIARIEVPEADIPRLVAAREKIVVLVKQAGFSYVTLDLIGYRSGSMDEVRGKTTVSGEEGS